MTISNRVRLLALPLLLILPACTQHGSATDTASSSAAPDAKGPITDAATAARLPMRPFRHSGLVGLVFSASHDVKPTDDQITAIEEIQTKLAVAEPASRTNYQEFQSHVAADIRAGKFDQAQLHADYGAFDELKHGEQARDVDALNELHNVLTPEQRTTVVAAVRARTAQADVQKLPEMPDGGVSDLVKQTLARMTQDLGLDAGQEKRVSDLLVKDQLATIAILPVHKEDQKRHAELFADTFEQPDFDAQALDALDGGAKSPHEQMEREILFLSRLVAILKPDQREKLASQRTPGQAHRMGPGGPGMGGPGMGGPGMGGPGMGMGHPGMGGGPGTPVAPPKSP